MGQQSITSLTMLQGMRDNDPAQWTRFVDLYSGLVYEWCRRSGISSHDAADVVQEVFWAVASSISEFHRDQNHGSFHGWLWGITRHKSMDHFRSKARQPHALGGYSANVQVQQLPQPFPEQPDAETFCADARLIYLRALELLQIEFETHTWQAFWRTTIEEATAAQAAQELGMTVGAVYNARYKVLHRLKSEFAGILDESENR